MTKRHWNSLEKEFAYYAACQYWGNMLLRYAKEVIKEEDSMPLDLNSIVSIANSTFAFVEDEGKKLVLQQALKINTVQLRTMDGNFRHVETRNFASLHGLRLGSLS